MTTMVLSDSATCTAPGCSSDSMAGGLCGPHYRRWWKTGDPIAPPIPACKIDDCGRPVERRHDGLCSSHGRRAQRYGDPLAHIPIGQFRGSTRR